MITIPEKVNKAIIEHIKGCYPHEACGILVGKERLVKIAYSTKNIVKDRARDRYEIDPKDFIEIDRKASENNLEIIGFYHSHPDHPSLPSQFDKERAWPDYIYLILAISRNGNIEEKAWVFNGNEFIEEVIDKK
jgi:proteasome lid subunit RPN8/RPN11